MFFSMLSQRLKAAFKLFGLFFIILFIYRIIFHFNFRIDETMEKGLIKAFVVGSRFDIRMALLFITPFLLFSCWPIFNPENSEMSKKYWARFYLFLLFVLLFFLICDFSFYSYKGFRLNSSVIGFLKNPAISLGMVFQSYPVILISLAVLAVIIILYFVLKIFIFNKSLVSESWPIPFGVKIAASLIVFFLYAFGVHGKLGQYPLRWSEAYFSTNTYLSNLALNPIQNFYDTIKYSEKSFDTDKVKKSFPVIKNYFNLYGNEPLDFKRPVKLTPLESDKKLNVVVIVMESLAAYKTGFLGENPMKPTPNLDEFSSESVSFSNFYVPVQSTAKSIFCLISGVPDVHLGSGTSSRNSAAIDQNSVAQAFKDYDNYYFLADSANWANIRGVIGNNIPNVKIFERGMYDSPNTDVWGLSDLALFKEVHNKINNRIEKEKPFFAIIQTAGYHRPHTIPKERDGFEMKEISESQMKEYGFSNEQEYNSLRFSDFSFGKFVELAKQSEYYKDTIFVVTGDHGLAQGMQARFLSKGIKDFELPRYHVPLLVHAGDYLTPKLITKPATEADILPTVAGLTGNGFINSSLGRNLFSEYDDNFAFLYSSSGKGQIGLLDEEHIVFGDLENINGLYNYKLNDKSLDVSAQYPQKYKKMKELAEAMFHTSSYLLLNNKK